MPKKLNFLGGQQNYDPKTGEYEPALKGPNGESPSSFKSFKKGDSKEKSKPFDATSKKKTLKEKWNEYINNGFEGDNTDYYNNLIQEIESEMPFKNQEEHDKWLDLGSTWNGEQEWLDMTEEIMSRKDKDESFDAINKKRMGKVNSADIIDDFSDRISQIEGDYSTDYLSDEEYKDAYKQLKADLEKNKNNLDEEEYKNLNEKIDRVLDFENEDFAQEKIDKQRYNEEKAKNDKKFPNKGSESNSNNLNPNNPKYKGKSRSAITNAKLVDEGYEFTNANGEKVKESIIEYIPYGALQDGDNRKLYGIVRNYDGSDSPNTGAIVSHSLEDAKQQLESQVKLGIQGSDRYLKRGQFDEDYFNLIRDNKEPGDDEKYKDRYGWDFNKPFKEHDFMKNDPYEKWKSEREYGERLNKILKQHPEYIKKYGSRENILKIMKELDGK